jgi:hypothetical protein
MCHGVAMPRRCVWTVVLFLAQEGIPGNAKQVVVGRWFQGDGQGSGDGHAMVLCTRSAAAGTAAGAVTKEQEL